jgi:hypothetical protein
MIKIPFCFALSSLICLIVPKHEGSLLELLDPEDEGIMILQNVGKSSPVNTAQHPRRPELQ